jgi:hypothetical protein
MVGIIPVPFSSHKIPVQQWRKTSPNIRCSSGCDLTLSDAKAILRQEKYDELSADLRKMLNVSRHRDLLM